MGPRRNWIVPLLLVLAGLAMTASHTAALRAGESSFADDSLNLLLVPMQATSTGFSSRLARWWTDLLQLGTISEEKQRLEATIEDLKEQNRHLQSLDNENKRLKEILGLSQQSPWKTVAGRVIARDPTNWFASLTLDVGQKDGVRKGMVVMCPTGLVGQIVYSSWNASRVRLITDSKSAVPCVLQPGTSMGMVYGEDGPTCEIRYLDPDAPIKEGDEVLTSGLGTIFPDGLVLGKVASISGIKDAMFKAAKVKPTARFDQLLEVLVLTDRKS